MHIGQEEWGVYSQKSQEMGAVRGDKWSNIQGNWIGILWSRLPQTSCYLVSLPFSQGAFLIVTHQPWSGLYVSPLWLCRKPRLQSILYIFYLSNNKYIKPQKQEEMSPFKGRKEKTHSGLRGGEGQRGDSVEDSPGESIVVTYQRLITQSLQGLEEPWEDDQLVGCLLLKHLLRPKPPIYSPSLIQM